MYFYKTSQILFVKRAGRMSQLHFAFCMSLFHDIRHILSVSENYRTNNTFRINLPLFSTVLPSNCCCFSPVGLSLIYNIFYRFQKTRSKCCINNERPTGQKQQLLDGRTVENKGKLLKFVKTLSDISNLNYNYF